MSRMPSPYYSADAVVRIMASPKTAIQSGLTYSQFKWSGQPERNVHEFLDWVLTVHHSVTEKLSLRKAIFNRDGTVIAAEITMKFRGNGNFQTDNFAVKWGRYGLGMARW
jgi:hypothetical protein